MNYTETMDNRTLGIALMFVAMAVAALGILLSRGRNDRSMSLWSWGFVSIIPGFGLLSLQGLTTPWLSIVLANVLALGFHFFMTLGMRTYAGRKPFWPWRFTVYYALWMVYILLFTFFWDSYLLRAAGSSFLIILLTGEIFPLFRDPPLGGLPVHVRRFMAAALGIFCLGHGARIAGLLLIPSDSLLGDHGVTTAYFLFNLAYSLIWPGLIWMLDSHRLLVQATSLARMKDKIWKMAGHDLRAPWGPWSSTWKSCQSPPGGISVSRGMILP